ncbi:MAG: FeoA domain-containing protein [Gemmatimonadales bacterium]
MPDPLIALLAFGLITIVLTAVFYPRHGIVPRLRQGMYLSERVRMEDALKHALHEQLEGRFANTNSLAGALEITRHGASTLLNELERLELVSIDDGVRLTEAGRSYAMRVLRSHRLWERYLADRTSVQPVDWHQKAEIAEHRLSEQEANLLASRMGHPLYDPHGDPIPTEHGDLPPLEGVLLTELAVGRQGTIVHIEDEPPETFERIVAEGIQPLMRVKLLDRSPSIVRVSIEGREHSLEPMVARNITVHPIMAADDDDEALSALSEVRPGFEATVVRISSQCQGPQRRRLLDLGFVPHTTIRAELESTARDPVAYRIRGAVIALRRAQADLIHVDDIRPVDASVEDHHVRAM